jgi:hypothetical protein
MARKSVLVFCLFLAAAFIFAAEEGQAMPNFARKYDATCDMCHTVVPKLTKLGYEFRLSGYRLPDEIGKDEKPFKLGDFFTARFQSQYKWNRSEPATGTETTSSQFEFVELTLYPLAGAWGKNFASLGEFSMAPDDVFETENAYIRYDTNIGKGIFQARVGIMHPWEGFGASDRPISLSRPLIQKSPATGNPFFLWNLDQFGIEAGYYYLPTGTALSLNLWNGIVLDDTGKAEPAQGGGLTKIQGEPGANDKDFQAVLTQIFPNEAGATLFYYRGVVPFPATTHLTRDTFHRIAAYGNYWVLPKTVNLLAGLGYGSDSLGDYSLAGAGNVGKSKGYFVEANYHLRLNDLGVAARYDWFDPSNKVDHNDQTAYTVALNVPSNIGLQGILEYQHKDTELTAGGKNKTDQVQARLIFIW